MSLFFLAFRFTFSLNKLGPSDHLWFLSASLTKQIFSVHCAADGRLGQKKTLLYWRNPTDPKIRPDPTFFFKPKKILFWL